MCSIESTLPRCVATGVTPLLLGTMWALCTAEPAAATPELACDVTLRGDINDKNVKVAMGEIARFEAEVDTIIRLCLDSPNGGSLGAARELVAFMEERASLRVDYGGVTTVVRNGMDCRSACALIFMAGFYCEYVVFCRTSRIMEPFATVGFHSPTLDIDAPLTDKATIQNAYYAAIEDLGYFVSLNSNADFVRSPTRYPGVLIKEITSNIGANYFFIRTIRDAIALNIDLIGTWRVPPSDVDEVHESLNNACDNYFWMNRVAKGFPFEAGHQIEAIPAILKGDPVSYIEMVGPLAGGSFIWESCYIPFYSDRSRPHEMIADPGQPYNMFGRELGIYASYSTENEIETSNTDYEGFPSSDGWNLEAIGAPTDDPYSFPEDLIETLFSSDDFWLFWSMDSEISEVAVRD